VIKQLDIKDYQAHADSHLEFDPGINIIVGSSDNGKSAVLRAMLWNLTNKPDGTSFIRHGQKGACVSVKLDDGTVVERERKGATVNEYRMDGEVFKKLGRGSVPEEIQQALNLSPDINIQGQLDSPFLLSQTPPEIARVLNKVAHLEEMTESLSNASKTIREVHRDISSSEAEKERIEEQLESLQWVSKAQEDLNAIIAEDDKAAEIENQLCDIRRALDSLLKTDKQIKSSEKLMKLDKQISKLDEALKQHDELDRRLDTIDRLLTTIEETDTKMKNCQASLKQVEKQLKEFDVCPYCGGTL